MEGTSAHIKRIAHDRRICLHRVRGECPRDPSEQENQRHSGSMKTHDFRQLFNGKWRIRFHTTISIAVGFTCRNNESLWRTKFSHEAVKISGITHACLSPVTLS